MYDGGKIIAGIIVFLGLMTFPFWYNVGQAAYKTPELQKPANAKQCIETAEWMKAEHMQLLNEWRDEVVRNGNRLYTSKQSGEHFEMSLQKTCMSCHTSKKEFCDKCHDAAAVAPYCWDCHIAPKEGM
ncbi:cytochrome c [Desulfobaculum xiamenense]|uniref:Cytochrome c n=1 Tax=Desulfobaculum xiamenense TaxID=995050 RepID=A0A846QPY1_9BACT|nr:sulfate reduction electron transfer complex DsrMKJOP subunit DsrJ [Desulfobaculum xiamenense]NJB69040.1 cytochrome c [Desulfobaculum xiamenense]